MKYIEYADLRKDYHLIDIQKVGTSNMELWEDDYYDELDYVCINLTLEIACFTNESIENTMENASAYKWYHLI